MIKDSARKWTDNKLVKMEKDLKNAYSTATKELTSKWKDFMHTQNAYIKDLQDAYYTAKNAGFTAEAQELGKQLGIAKRDLTLQNKYYKEMVEETTKKIAEANQNALTYINGQMPSIYVKNYNEALEMAQNLGLKYSLINDDVVNKMVYEGDLKLPKKKISIPKDMQWNTRQLNSAVLQGIIQGESMDDIAKRIFPIVNNNTAAAIRNARTMVTGAENSGRLDSYERLEDDGIVLKKVWMATPDDRTRISHLELDGEEVDIHDKFSNGLMYPADPDGEPEEVYNCRCTMVTNVVGFKRADGSISYIEKDEDDTVETLHQKQMQEEISRRKALIKEQTEVSMSQSEKDKLNELRSKYTNLENAMLLGSDEDIRMFAELQQKELASSTAYDYDIKFKNQNISENTIYSWQKEIDNDVKSAIGTYTQSGYVEMNNHLRFGNFAREKTKKEINDLHNYLNSCKTQETIYLKRGMSLGNIEKVFKDLKVGSVFTDKGFVSTTPYSGGGFGGNVVCYIKAPKGTKGAYIRKYAKAENEKEFLFDKNQSFIIRNVQTKKEGFMEKTIIFMEAIV